MSFPEKIKQHNKEIQLNIQYLEKKPLLRRIYNEFYRIVREGLSTAKGDVLELGSGIGLIKESIPECICTDIFENPWIERVENAYRLSDKDETLSNIILIDVFHHLRFPGTALREWHRVLANGGRVILFEPDMGLLGKMIYGVFHHEPIALKDKIEWEAPKAWKPTDIDYYAAQGNAHRIFHKQKINNWEKDFKLVSKQRFSFVSYVASGGFSKPQLYPTGFYPAMKRISQLLDLFPILFSTRICVVLEKR